MSRAATVATRRPRIFVQASGQDDNIGDIVLRRQMLHAIRPFGELHVSLQGVSGAFVDSLNLSPADVVYTSDRVWFRRALRDGWASPIWFVDKPGEIQLSRSVLLRQLKLLPVALVARARRGGVVRLGVGQRESSRRATPLFKALFRTSSVLGWRDVESLRSFRIGQMFPDWAFLDSREVGSEPRDLLAISYRSDRPILSDEALAALKLFATQHELSIKVVAQVRRDSARAADLAERLSSEFVPWVDEHSQAEHERTLRDVYRRSAIVVSDRLHVLIVAASEGAVPSCVIEYDDIKVGRHFDAVGWSDVSMTSDARTSAEIGPFLQTQIDRRDDLATTLTAAQARMEDTLGATFDRLSRTQAP